MRVNSLIFLVFIFIMCDAAPAAPTDMSKAERNDEFSVRCGVTLKLPELLSDGGRRLQTCIDSYKETGGTVLSLAPVDLSVHDANWIDRIPMLHIEQIGIDEIIKRNGGNVFRNTPTGRVIAAAVAPAECKLKVKTAITKISGSNWHGWLAGDKYIVSDHDAPSPEYCRQYSEINRCIRMVIGNSRQSATMAQYCLTRDPGGFDLDAGLSYDVFTKIVKTIHFTEQ